MPSSSALTDLDPLTGRNRQGGLSRRRLLGGVAAAGAVGAGGAVAGLNASPIPARTGVTLVAAPQRVQLAGASAPSEVWSYGTDAAPVVHRVQRGQPWRATLVNRLPEHTAIHWHGVRVPNAMDGVPYLTQPPVLPGERFDYAFTPPDSGTFFFHPHCDTAQQLGRGLAGVLIVEAPDDPPFDADLVLAYKDWIVAPDGTLGPFLTPAGAARAGTFGNLATVNGAVDPVLEVPAGADIRLRFLVLDNSRIVDLAVRGGAAWIIATDGNALDPLLLDEWRMGPAMRVDLALRTPASPEAEVGIFNNRAARPIRLASLRTKGAARRSSPFNPPRLAGPHLPTPDLVAATTLPVILGNAGSAGAPPDVVLPDGQVLRYADALCLATDGLWAINREVWPAAAAARLPPPLAILDHGRTYILELQNISKVSHPMHLHGHSFLVLDSSAGTIQPHWADTTLLQPRERRRVAFVADNPGDWMIHCHIIEHQETGMMGILRVA